MVYQACGGDEEASVVRPHARLRAEWLCPTICVFNEDGSVDYEGNERVIDRVVSGGVDGVVLLGSNGEFFHLTEDERRQLISCAASAISGRAKLIVGTGSTSQDEAIVRTRRAHAGGADAALVVGPYYFKMAQEQIEGYFDAVAASTDGAVMLYNFPAYTGNDVTPEIARAVVARHDNVVGYKDSVPDVAHTRGIIEAVTSIAPDFAVFSGFDENFAHNVLAGGAGSIGALSNIVPEVCAAWVAAARGGDFEGLRAGQRVIDALMGIYDVACPFMPAIRYAMNLCGLGISEACRAPYVRLTKEQERAVEGILRRAGIPGETAGR